MSFAESAYLFESKKRSMLSAFLPFFSTENVIISAIRVRVSAAQPGKEKIPQSCVV